MMTDVTKVKKLYDEIAQIEQSMKAMSALFVQIANIHNHTRTLGQNCKTLFYPLDDKYTFSNPKKSTLDTVMASILTYAEHDPKITDIKTVLNTIKKAGASIEGETGLNVGDLLIRTWSLAEKAHPGSDPMGLIVYCLKDNIAAGGGCLAGISARLIQPYTALVQAKLLDELESTLLPSQMVIHLPQDSDLEQAIQQSLKENTRYENDNKHSYTDGLDEAAALKKAMEESLRENQAKQEFERKAQNEANQLAMQQAEALKAAQAVSKLKLGQAPQAPAITPNAATYLPSVKPVVQAAFTQISQQENMAYAIFEAFDSEAGRKKYAGGIHNCNKGKINSLIHELCNNQHDHAAIAKIFQEMLQKKLAADKPTYQVATTLLKPNAFKYDATLHAVRSTGFAVSLSA